MKLYENLLMQIDEWFITSTLTLADDGRFRYQESWDCYAGSAHARTEGTWRQTAGLIVLLPERIDGALRLELAEGREFKAIERDDCLDFGNGFTMTEKRP